MLCVCFLHCALTNTVSSQCSVSWKVTRSGGRLPRKVSLQKGPRSANLQLLTKTIIAVHMLQRNSVLPNPTRRLELSSLVHHWVLRLLSRKVALNLPSRRRVRKILRGVNLQAALGSILVWTSRWVPFVTNPYFFSISSTFCPNSLETIHSYYRN